MRFWISDSGFWILDLVEEPVAEVVEIAEVDCGSEGRQLGPVSEHHQGRDTEEGSLYLATSSPRSPFPSFFHTGWVGEWLVTTRSGSQSRHSPTLAIVYCIPLPIANACLFQRESSTSNSGTADWYFSRKICRKSVDGRQLPFGNCNWGIWKRIAVAGG